ncbi:HAD family hydrolase [Breoghania sp. L-A4]|uniref:HAD family hydrolase n=1 Tax=Breoghania sp. L-A4 TaxID=2304600 RepID=UPI000E36029A|nr:HAD family hydrolase [Breoghania sp. L-A4]AXS40844.1 HAD family hydrolase [Breoghania sp. L-A4]
MGKGNSDTRRSRVLFDLDGTLTDPFPGITGSIRYALERMGAPVPEADALRWCIGPPLPGSFALMLGTEDTDTLDRAVGFYRERFSDTGLFENVVYDGIPEMLEDLISDGFSLYLATSKPLVYASRIVTYFGLQRYFAGLYGSELDGTRAEKTALLAHVLDREGIAPQDAVMIGDRKHDLIGARANGVTCIGVTYGYGARAELEAEGPCALADTPEDVGVQVRAWAVS